MMRIRIKRRTRGRRERRKEPGNQSRGRREEGEGIKGAGIGGGGRLSNNNRTEDKFEPLQRRRPLAAGVSLMVARWKD